MDLQSAAKGGKQTVASVRWSNSNRHVFRVKEEFTVSQLLLYLVVSPQLPFFNPLVIQLLSRSHIGVTWFNVHLWRSLQNQNLPPRTGIPALHSLGTVSRKLRLSGVSILRYFPPGSIQGPYRVPNTFPQCNTVSSVDGLLETYTRSLLSTGNGYPNWELGGNLNRPQEHIKQGVSVGDVGILDPDGDLAVSFNIFRPPGDPIQDRLPEGFQEVIPNLDRNEDIELNPNYFSPGSVISSTGVHVEIVSKDPL